MLVNRILVLDENAETVKCSYHYVERDITRWELLDGGDPLVSKKKLLDSALSCIQKLHYKLRSQLDNDNFNDICDEKKEIMSAVIVAEIPSTNPRLPNAHEFQEYGVFNHSTMKKGDIFFFERPLLISFETDIHLFTELLRPMLASILATFNKCDRAKVAEFLLPGNHFSPILAFPHCSETTKADVMHLQCPVDLISDASCLFSLRSLATKLKESNKAGLSKESENTIFRLLIICAANVYGGEDDSIGKWVALFKLGCRVNHSCQPFARWKLGTSFPSSSMLEYESVSQQDRRSFKGRISNEVLVFFSNKDILPGEEITHSYLERERWRPTHLRKSFLLKSRLFDCCCKLCSQRLDMHRCFKCYNCGHLGSLLAPVRDNGQINTPKSLPISSLCECIKCGFILSQEASDELLSEELKWEELICSITSSLSTNSSSSSSKSESVRDISSVDTMAKAVNMWSSVCEHAPLHWTAIDLADYLQSIADSLSSPETFTNLQLQLQLQRQSKHCLSSSSSSTAAAAVNELSSILSLHGRSWALQFRRIVASLHVFPVATDLILLVVLDLVEKMQQSLALILADDKDLKASAEMIELSRDRAFILSVCGVEHFQLNRASSRVPSTSRLKGIDTDDNSDKRDEVTDEIISIWTIIAIVTWLQSRCAHLFFVDFPS